MNLSAELFRLLGDTHRLRILRLLSMEKLNVTELTEILAAAQSGVSRHLRLLREANLVSEDRERGWAYYHVDSRSFTGAIAGFWPVLQDHFHTLPESQQDDARLQEILRQRSEDFRDPVSAKSSPGRSWAAWARTLSYLAPRVLVADLGCGEGYLTLEVARWARRVMAVDRSAAMLTRAKELAKRQGVRNIRWKRALIEKLPLKDASFDMALIAQVLRTLQDPAVGLREALRILKPGGKLLLQELRSHREEWVRTKLGDVWLGFEEKELRVMLKNAGFTKIQLDIGSKRRGDPFTVLIGCASKPRRRAE